MFTLRQIEIKRPRDYRVRLVLSLFRVSLGFSQFFSDVANLLARVTHLLTACDFFFLILFDFL